MRSLAPVSHSKKSYIAKLISPEDLSAHAIVDFYLITNVL